MRFILLLLTAATTIAAAPSPTFPTNMRDAWAKEVSLCEPEFTGGYTIRRDRITYYEGIDRLVSIGTAKSVRTPYGLGKSVFTKLRWEFHDETSSSTVRLTVAGDVMYRSDARDPLSKHLTTKNRLRTRCAVRLSASGEFGTAGAVTAGFATLESAVGAVGTAGASKQDRRNADNSTPLRKYLNLIGAYTRRAVKSYLIAQPFTDVRFPPFSDIPER